MRDEAIKAQGNAGADEAANTLFRYSPLLILAAGLGAAGRAWALSRSLALPPLSDVISAWIDLLRDGDLVTNGAPVALSRWRRVLRLPSSSAPCSALRMAWWKPVNVLVAPLVEIFYPLPKSALIPVTVIWLGFGDGSKILLIFLGCMLPVTIGAFNGARGCDAGAVWSARSMGASRLRVLWDVVLPSAMPELLNGIRTALALAFILLVSLRTDRGAKRLRLSDRLARRERLLRGDVCGRVHRRLSRLCRRPHLSDARAAGADMAAVEQLPVQEALSLRAIRAQPAVRLAPAVACSCCSGRLAGAGGSAALFTPFQLPSFTAVLARIWTDAVAGDLWINTGVTLYRALVGFVIAGVGGIVLGMAMSRVRLAHWFFDPIVSIGFPMPKIAFLPVIILWLGVYDVPKITMIVFDAIFPVIAATMIGIEGVERELVWSARNMGAKERELLWQMVLPAALPQIMTGLQVALPLSLIVAVVTEMLMGGYGLGGAMMTASRFANSPGVFAGIVEIAVVGYVLVKAMALVRRRLLIWHPEALAIRARFSLLYRMPGPPAPRLPKTGGPSTIRANSFSETAEYWEDRMRLQKLALAGLCARS